MKQQLELESVKNCVLKGRYEILSSIARQHTLPAAEERLLPERTLIATGIELSFCNAIVENNENAPLEETQVDHAINFFRNKKLPFIWWNADRILEKKGLQFGGVFKGIAAEISVPREAAQPTHDIFVKKVQTNAEKESFYKIMGEVYSIPRTLLNQFSIGCEAAVNAGDAINFLGYLDKTPVSIVTLAIGNAAAGLWSLGTLPDARKKGLASAVVTAAVEEAKARQYDHMMAILTPEAMAKGLFDKLGFKVACDMPCYFFDSV